MREIKFRAWDKQEKKMYPVAEISFGDEGLALTLMVQTAPMRKFHQTLVHGENCDLMLYTGLKDKNGKEVYDGDIIAVDDYNPIGGQMRRTFEVLFGDYENGGCPSGDDYKGMIGFWLKGITFFRDGNYEHDMSYSMNPLSDGVFEVIGTIHENPELLKDRAKRA